MREAAAGCCKQMDFGGLFDFLVLFWLFCTLLFGEEHWDMEDIGEKKDFGSPSQSVKLFFE